jgi:hypothetical protein
MYASKKQKSRRAQAPMATRHVGLLTNESPGIAELFFI